MNRDHSQFSRKVEMLLNKTNWVIIELPHTKTHEIEILCDPGYKILMLDDEKIMHEVAFDDDLGNIKFINI